MVNSPQNQFSPIRQKSGQDPQEGLLVPPLQGLLPAASQMALMVKNPSVNTGDIIRDAGSVPGLGRYPGVGHGNPTPVFLPGESHGQRVLQDYSPWGHKAWGTT